MRTHTSKPWEYNPDTRQVIAHNDLDCLICEVTDTAEGLEGDCPEADPNGYLIAASPDLLAACRLILDRHSYQGNGELWPSVKAEVRAAVAKADRLHAEPKGGA